LPERRLIIHLSGEAEIGLSDGTKHIFHPGDVRLMEDTTGRGHTHRDLSQNTAVYVLLRD
jgi:redox-sensitive bicupin YhaK (pirin superfamily)